MNLNQMFSIWRRRWVLTTALLLLALLGTAAATQVLPKSYQAQSTVTLLPSTAFSATNGDNPYLSFDGSLPVTAQLISFQLMDPRTVQFLSNEGYSASYTSALDPNSTGAVLQTVVLGSNKALVERTLVGATNEISTEMASLQAGLPEKDKITVETLSMDPKPTLELSKTARPIVVVLFFGLVLALGIPLVIDGQVSRSHKLAKSRKQPARRAVRAPVPDVPGPRTPAPSVPPARLEQAAAPVTSPAATRSAATPPATAPSATTPSAARPEWGAKPAEPDWDAKPAEPDWDAKPADPEWLPTTPTARPEPAKPGWAAAPAPQPASTDWPAAPVPQPARTEWSAAPVARPGRPEWLGKSAAPLAEGNGADSRNGADVRNGSDTRNGAGATARTEWPAKPAASLFEPDRDEPSKPPASLFERDRDEPSKPASSRFHRDDEPAKPASSRFHRDDDGPAKPAAPMPWEDHAKDASPAAGGGGERDGQNGSGKDHHDRRSVSVPVGTSTSDPDDDGPTTQPQERVT